jgi:hypothetical protein
MTDLVALPKPRFTTRGDSFNRVADCKCCGWIKSGDAAKFDHFRDGGAWLQILDTEEG